MKGSLPSDAEVKALADEFTSVLNVSFQTEAVRSLVSRWLRKNYNKELEKQELKFDMNFMGSENTMRFLENAVFENIKGITAELQARMKREISQGMAAGENRSMLKKRIADIFRGNNQTRFRFEDRIKMIARTEKHRILSFSQLDVAKELPFKTLKRLDVILDRRPDGRWRTSNICRAMHHKYGTDEQAIPLSKPFKLTKSDYAKAGVKSGPSISAMAPPFHPNGRTGLVTVIPEEEDEEED